MKVIESGLSERIQTVLKLKRLTYAQLGELIGVTPGAVGQYVAGRTKSLSATTANKFRVIGIEPDWIAEGKGPMEVEESEVVPASVYFTGESLTQTKTVSVDKDFVESMFGVVGEPCFCRYMQNAPGYFAHGDILLCDKGQTNIVPGRWYMVVSSGFVNVLRAVETKQGIAMQHPAPLDMPDIPADVVDVIARVCGTYSIK